MNPNLPSPCNVVLLILLMSRHLLVSCHDHFVPQEVPLATALRFVWPPGLIYLITVPHEDHVSYCYFHPH